MCTTIARFQVMLNFNNAYKSLSKSYWHHYQSKNPTQANLKPTILVISNLKKQFLHF